MSRRDLGLQAERTELAWVRTALVCAAIAGFVIHLAGGAAADLAALAGGLAVGTIGMVAAAARIRSLRRPVPQPASPIGVALLAGAVASTHVLALALVLT